MAGCPGCGGVVGLGALSCTGCGTAFTCGGCGTPMGYALGRCSACGWVRGPSTEYLNEHETETAAPGVLKSRRDLKRLTAAGEGSTGLAADARRHMRLGEVELVVAVAVAVGIALLVLANVH